MNNTVAIIGAGQMGSGIAQTVAANGIDVLLATSKHNVQYLLGGYRFIFFSAMDAIGHSRYLPIVAYIKGAPEKTAYVANKMEGMEHANRPFWTPHFFPVAWGTRDAMAQAIKHLKAEAPASPRIGIEPGFLPLDAARDLEAAYSNAPLVDACGVLERLQAAPVIIEDGCFLGARSEVVEGVIVERGAVLAMGVFISQSTPIYDREADTISFGRVPFRRVNIRALNSITSRIRW